MLVRLKWVEREERSIEGTAATLTGQKRLLCGEVQIARQEWAQLIGQRSREWSEAVARNAASRSQLGLV
jgi:hypothetical protein